MAMRRVTRGQNRYSPVVLNTASVPKPKRQKRKETLEEAIVVANNIDWAGAQRIVRVYKATIDSTDKGSAIRDDTKIATVQYDFSLDILS